MDDDVGNNQPPLAVLGGSGIALAVIVRVNVPTVEQRLQMAG
jgi:hypothetical protein